MSSLLARAGIVKLQKVFKNQSKFRRYSPLLISFYPFFYERKNIEDSPLNQNNYHDSFDFASIVPKETIPRMIFYAKVFARGIQLSFLFLPMIMTLPLCFYGNYWLRKWVKWLVVVLKASGPTFIKLGQWASTRPDILPRVACRGKAKTLIFNFEELSVLYDEVIYKPYKETEKAILEELQIQNVNEIFKYINPDPIGAGCIAQVIRNKGMHEFKVYYAELKDDVEPDFPSRRVIIKVQHPHCESLIKKDLTLIYYGFMLVNLFPSMKWINIHLQFSEFSSMMMKQLNFRVESENLSTFNSSFHGLTSKFVRIKFPVPLNAKSTGRLLIETFEDAFSIKNLFHLSSVTNDEYKSLKKTTALLGIKMFLKMMLLDNFTHADLHPGNILIRFAKKEYYWLQESDPFTQSIDVVDGIEAPKDIPDTILDFQTFESIVHNEEYCKYYEPEIVALDAGLVTQLKPSQFRDFLDLFSALSIRDGYNVGKLIIDRAPPSLTKPIMPEQFCQKMDTLVRSIIKEEGGLNLKDAQFSSIVYQTFKMVREHQVILDHRYTNLLMSLIILEGLGRELSPDIDLLKLAQPVLELALRYWK